MMPAKKLTKFKSKKSKNKPKNLKPTKMQRTKSSKKEYVLPSHAQVMQTQQALAPQPSLHQQPIPPQHPHPPINNQPQFSQPSINQPQRRPLAQSQFVPPTPPIIPSSIPVIPAVATAQRVSPVVATAQPVNIPIANKGIVNSLKISTQSVLAADVTVEKQLELKTEELTDQVIVLSEITDSLLLPDWTPDGIIDILHVMVTSFDLDVLTLVLPSMNYPKYYDNIISRGYEIAPYSAITNLWLKTFNDSNGIDWDKLMNLAEDTKTELAYWIIHEGLHSIGYVPIRDNNFIYGFLFTAAKQKKKLPLLTAPMLEVFGTLLGFAYGQKFTN